jgi:Ca-activated chloride channel family protein
VGGPPGVTVGLLLVGLLAQFAARVDLVEVYASVAGPDGRPLTGLTAGDFVVRENGVEQRIEAFAEGDFPLSVAVALDHSFSMAGSRLALAKAGALAFLDALRPGDRALVAAVSSDVRLLGPLSTDRVGQRRAIDGLSPWGTTSLHDAILRLLDELAGAAGRRALVVLSDGEDRYSRASSAEVVERARRSDILIYGIALGPRPSGLFEALARLTGGRALHLERPEGLRAAFGTIAADLRHQYLLGYAPRPGGPRGWRSIEVRVAVPGARVRARSGYIAP